MKIQYIDGKILKRMFQQGSHILNKNQQNVDSLNVFPVPDGDTGTNMSLTVNSAINQISKVTNVDVESISKAASNGSLMGARGNSGVILSQIFRGFEKGCRDKKVLTVRDFSVALKEASDTAYKAVMKPIEGTILTVIREISDKAMEISNDKIDFDKFFYEIIKHGEITLEKTPELLNVLKQAGVVDAGGKGLIFILKGFWNGLLDKEDIIEDDFEKAHVDELEGKSDYSSEITFGYCTEFIIKGHNLSTDILKEKIKDLGDSVLVVGDEDLIKVHIHTNNPGNALEYGLNMGELIDVKIDNMRQQHKNRIITDNYKKEDKEQKKYGFISIAMGEGLYSIFADLNVDKVIKGGQTMNPSTEDLLKAVNEINAENIFILPNNSNIILTANQVKDLSDKNIIVIPTKTIPQGISSLLEFDTTSDINNNYEKMTGIINKVKTIQITCSVRDSKYNDLDIKEGDILGISDGEIITVGKDVEDVAIRALGKVLDTKDFEILTMYYGSDIEKNSANSFASSIRSKYDEMDVEVYFGGQPLYYYIFSAE